MTLDRYPLFSFLKVLNLYKTGRSINQANHEQKVVAEAYRMLGYANYQNVSELDELKALYWSIHDRVEMKQKLEDAIEALEEDLSEALQTNEANQLTRKESVNAVKVEISDLIVERNELRYKLDLIDTDAKKQIAIYQGLLAQKKHLDDPKAPEVAEINEEINSSLAKLTEYKEQKNQVTTEHQATLLKIKDKEESLSSIKQGDGDSAIVDSQHSVTGKSKDLADMNRNLAQINEQLDKDYHKVGLFLYESRSYKDVRQCITEDKRILDHIKALRRSIRLHQKLAH